MDEVPYLVRRYFQINQEQGRHPCPVHLVRSLGGVQPVGYSIGWSTNRREAEKMAERTEGRWEIVTIHPPRPPA